MKMMHRLSVTGLALLFTAGAVFAQQDEGDLEGTIRLMGDAEAELPEAVTREITLPDNIDVDAAAVDASAEGLATANEARQNRGQGLSVADEARENAADMAEEARENAENRSRADEFRPETPEVPDRPDVPTPPTGRN